MIIDRDIRKYIIFSEDTILHALEKISQNKMGVIFAVSESGLMEGIMSDGDFRRWLIEENTIDLHRPVSTTLNDNFLFCSENDSSETILSLFSDRIEYIPILDDHKRLVAVATHKKQQIVIGDYVINDNSPCFIIAEIGNNHNGNIDLAKKLVDQAVLAGATCAKFQMRSMESLYRKTEAINSHSEDLGTEYTLDLLTKFQLSDENMLRIFDYCFEKGIVPLCTPWDLESLNKLDRYGIEAFKIASADLTNHELLKAAAQTNKPLLCSTGMSTDLEISLAVDLLRKQGAQFVLLHCNSTYPSPFKDINLQYLSKLKKIGDSLVGYSGHERGISVAIAAVSMGARVVEKHLTLDTNMEGNDHKVSLLPNEFNMMVQGIREVELAIGNDGSRRLSQGELINRENLAKSLVINCELKKGDLIRADMIEIRSPGKGIAPYRMPELLGEIAKRDFKKGDFFYPSDVEAEAVKAGKYNIYMPWGLPVRFHDALTIYNKSNMDLLEFHLSYKDLDLNIHDYFKEPLSIDFVVHSPELFSGDHIMDICSKDEEYRKRSVRDLQKVINITKELKRYFPKTKRPCIVTNVGGFTSHGHLPYVEHQLLYDLFLKSMSELDMDSVEIIPQTMPPFPWHFGGQRFHNLFVDPEEIALICKENALRVCLDISHSKLACNQYNWSFKEFIKLVGAYTAHIHIADAMGTDGEGLQIGEGEIDFQATLDDLNEYAPKASFIPEIWQGHKNEGEGFWKALALLEKFFNIRSS